MNRRLTTILLPALVPLAGWWVGVQERRILARGVPLEPEALADARTLGVRDPEAVRVLRVPRVPLPSTRWLAGVAARLTGSMPMEPTGLAAGRGIYLRAGYEGSRSLIAHELVHTMQYQRLGGIRPFLEQYLAECLSRGYANAPLEIEAIERSVWLLAQRSPQDT